MTKSHHEIQVADVMTRGVFTLTDTQSLPLAEAMMDRLHVRHIPVLDSRGCLVGILSQRDVLRAKISSLAPLTNDEGSSIQLSVPVSRIMRGPVTVVRSDALAVHAAHLMSEHEVGCLPVVDDDGLIGIVTESDLLELVTDAIALERPAKPWTMERVMTPVPVTIGADTSLADARKTMEQFRIRHLPVVVAGRPRMVVGERDLGVAEAIFPDAKLTPAAHAARLIGCPDARHVDRTALVRDVLADMARDRLDAVLIMDFGRLIGIFTTTDACRYLADAASGAAPAAGGPER